jgi:hypothetical protein
LRNWEKSKVSPKQVKSRNQQYGPQQTLQWNEVSQCLGFWKDTQNWSLPRIIKEKWGHKLPVSQMKSSCHCRFCKHWKDDKI